MKDKKKDALKTAHDHQSINISLSFPSNIYQLITPIILTIFTWLCYYSSLQYDFQFDDVSNIKKFFAIRHKTFSTLFFDSSRWVIQWLNTINYRFGKFDPFVYRFGNVLFHCIAGTLVFYILLNALSRLKKENFFSKHAFWIAFLTSGLFLLHPVQTQTVSYVIQGQLEGLATLFTLGIVYCFLRLTQAQSMLSKVLLTIVLYALSLFSTGTKEIAIVSPLLVLLVDWFFVAQGNFNELKRRWHIHLGLFSIVFISYLYLLKPTFFKKIFTFNMTSHNNLGNVLTHNPADKIKPFPFFISQFKVILHYLWIFVWPFNICVEYDWKLSQGFFTADSFLPFLLLGVIGWYVFYLLKNNKTHLIAFAAFWFAIAIAPRSSIIPSAELLVDYKTYLASVAILFLIASAIIKIFILLLSYFKNITHLNNYYLQFSIFSLLLISLGAGTYSRNKVWRSGLDFWGNIIQNAPGKARAYNNYGTALSLSGNHKKAIPYYKKAIKLDKYYSDPLNNLAVAYASMNKIDLAIKTLYKSIKLQKYHPETYNNLASFLITKKKYEEAKKILNIALRLRPHYGKAMYNYGKLYLQQGDAEQGLSYFKKACLEGDLDNVDGFTIYARTALRLQKYNDAIFAYKKLIELQPQSTEYYINLANAYVFNNEYDKADVTYKQAQAQKPHDAKIYYNMGESYFRQKKYTQSLEAFNMALKLKFNAPSIYLRIAACCEILGDITNAKRILVKLQNKSNIPKTVKMQASKALAQLEKPWYKETKTIA